MKELRGASRDPALANWGVVTPVDPTGRSQGWGVPHWFYQNDTLTHLPGYGDDTLCLRTPLRGDFELHCDLRILGYKEARIRYGAQRLTTRFWKMAPSNTTFITSPENAWLTRHWIDWYFCSKTRV